MAYYRMRPPRIKEPDIGKWYAAALESFSRVTAGVPVLKRDKLIGDFGEAEDGWLKWGKRKKLESKLAEYGVFVERRHARHGIDDLKGALNGTLRASHTVLIVPMPNRKWRVLTVYGVDNWIIFMEPYEGVYDKTYLKTFPKQVNLNDFRGYFLIWRTG